MRFGTFELGYLRDEEKHDVDFVVARDGEPRFLVEVKYGDESLSANFKYVQDQTTAPFAPQVTVDAEYVEAGCFAEPGNPLKIPARTFLSQLL